MGKAGQNKSTMAFDTLKLNGYRGMSVGVIFEGKPVVVLAENNEVLEKVFDRLKSDKIEKLDRKNTKKSILIIPS